MDNNLKQRSELLDNIKSKIDSLKKNNRILSLKHAELKFWHDFVQITTIILSTLLTFIESIKNELNLDTSGYIITQKIFSLIPIFFSTIIALSLSILKFKRYTEEIEESIKLSERYISVLNKFRKLRELILNSKDNSKIDQWRKDLNVSIESYSEVKQNFDKIIKFKELIFYNKKYNLLYKKDRLITNNRKFITENYKKIYKEDTILFYYFNKFCCFCCKKIYNNDTNKNLNEENNNVSNVQNENDNKSDDENDNKSDNKSDDGNDNTDEKKNFEV
jgi:hypothetical protein